MREDGTRFTLHEAARFLQERLDGYFDKHVDWLDLVEARQVMRHTLDDLNRGSECPCRACGRLRERAAARV